MATAPKKEMGSVGEAGGYKVSLSELQVAKFKRAFKAQDKDKDVSTPASIHAIHNSLCCACTPDQVYH
jgi:hypothetical protein